MVMYMKKFLLLILLIFVVSLTACNKTVESESQEKEEEVENMQDITILEKNDDGEITKGTLEGYTFVQTDEVTNRVKLQMENGDIILFVLSNKDTPKTIANFKKLVSEHFYDGLIFHRVIKDFMIQTGDPTGTGTGGSDKTIKGEFKSNGVKNDLSHTRGVVSMARSQEMNSASSQFFIVQADSTYLDGNYAGFGKVFAGMDAVDKIANVKTNDETNKPLEEQKIKSIRFVNIED